MVHGRGGELGPAYFSAFRRARAVAPARLDQKFLYRNIQFTSSLRDPRSRRATGFQDAGVDYRGVPMQWSTSWQPPQLSESGPALTPAASTARRRRTDGPNQRDVSTGSV